MTCLNTVEPETEDFAVVENLLTVPKFWPWRRLTWIWNKRLLSVILIYSFDVFCFVINIKSLALD